MVGDALITPGISLNQFIFREKGGISTEDIVWRQKKWFIVILLQQYFRCTCVFFSFSSHVSMHYLVWLWSLLLLLQQPAVTVTGRMAVMELLCVHCVAEIFCVMRRRANGLPILLVNPWKCTSRKEKEIFIKSLLRLELTFINSTIYGTFTPRSKSYTNSAPFRRKL